MAELGGLLSKLIKAASGGRIVRPGEAGYGASYGKGTAAGEARLPDPGGVGATAGRDESLRQARLEAERRAGGRVPLLGLPTEAQSVAGRPFIPGPVGKAHDVAEGYMAGRDYGVGPLQRFYPLDKERARGIAQEFERMPLFDPRALPSYERMAKETLDQYRAIKDSGLRLTPVDAAGYPYGANPREVALDVGDRGHMAFFKTEPESGAFGSGGEANIAQNHPLLRQSGERVGDYPMSYNDLFRVVHDYFGHIQHGFGFRAGGEDMAWRSHAGMYSPEARPAMTSETRGQNSWVNYGPHGDFNRTANAADTIYSPQKVALMPAWTMDDLVKRGLIAAPVVAGGAAALTPGEAEAAPAFKPQGAAQYLKAAGGDRFRAVQAIENDVARIEQSLQGRPTSKRNPWWGQENLDYLKGQAAALRSGTPAAGGLAAGLSMAAMPGEAQAGQGGRPGALVSPPVNPAQTTATQGLEWLRKTYVPNITNPATYGPQRAPSLDQAQLPPAPNMGAPGGLLKGTGPTVATSEFPAEGLETGRKVPNLERDPRVEGVADDLANLVANAAPWPGWGAASATAKALLFPRMMPRGM